MNKIRSVSAYTTPFFVIFCVLCSGAIYTFAKWEKNGGELGKEGVLIPPKKNYFGGVDRFGKKSC